MWNVTFSVLNWNQNTATDTSWTLDANGSWHATDTTTTADGASHLDYSFGYIYHNDYIITDDSGQTLYASADLDVLQRQETADYGYSSDKTVTPAGTSGSASGDGTADGSYVAQYLASNAPSTRQTYNYTENWSQDFATDSQTFTGINTVNVVNYTLAGVDATPEESALPTITTSAPGFWSPTAADEEAGLYLYQSPVSLSGPTCSVPGSGFGYNTSTPCFAAGTQVVGQDATGQAVDKNIEDIQMGDKVLTRDQNHPDSPLEYRTVTNVEVHTVKSLRLLTITQPDGTTETLKTTDNHPFWVKDDTQAEGGRWVEAKDLQVGDQLRTSDDHWVTLSGTTAEAHPEGITVYNLTVDGDHTYFVAAATGNEAIWVHNTDPTTQPTPPDVKAGPGGIQATTKLAVLAEERSRAETEVHCNYICENMTSQELEEVIQNTIKSNRLTPLERRNQQEGMRNTLLPSEGKQKYLADYEGLTPPDPKIAWIPVVGAVDRGIYEFKAGHWVAGITQMFGVSAFEWFYIAKPIVHATGAMRPTAAMRAASIETAVAEQQRLAAAKQVAIEGEADALPEGSFSIIDWSGYPEGLPRPQGPFRLLEGAEYDAAREAANAANRAMHQADPALKGLQIHEIQPVKFGGSPIDLLNKVPLTPQVHLTYTTWWNNLMRSLQNGG